MKKRYKIIYLLTGLFSLAWFLLRTGLRPSRVVYPCQRATLANVGIGLSFFSFLKSKKISKCIIAAIVVIAVFAVYLIIEKQEIPSEYLVQDIAQEEQLAIEKPSSDIFVVQNTNGADNGFEKLIKLMENKGLRFYDIIKKDDVVIIKVNCQWHERGGTNSDLVKSIIRSILNHPAGFEGEIIIADNGQAQFGSKGRGGSLDWENNNAIDRSQSMQDVAEEFEQVSTYLWDEITETEVNEYHEDDMQDGYVLYPEPDEMTGIRVSYPKFRTEHGTYISFKMGIWDPDTRTYDSDKLKVLNVPVLKSHFIYDVTAAVKHYMGVVSDKLAGHKPHRNIGMGAMGTQIAETRMPALNIIDAIWINPVSGPSTSYSQAVQTNTIAASTDPIAIDHWSAKNILIPAAEQIGHPHIEDMDPDTGSFGKWLRLSMQEINRRGYQTTMDRNKMNVYVS